MSPLYLFIGPFRKNWSPWFWEQNSQLEWFQLPTDPSQVSQEMKRLRKKHRHNTPDVSRKTGSKTGWKTPNFFVAEKFLLGRQICRACQQETREKILTDAASNTGIHTMKPLCTQSNLSNEPFKHQTSSKNTPTPCVPKKDDVGGTEISGDGFTMISRNLLLDDAQHHFSYQRMILQTHFQVIYTSSRVL